MKSIRVQLTLWLIAALVLLFGSGAVFCYARVGKVLGRQFDAALQGKARALSALVQREANGRVEVTPFDASMPEFRDVRHPEYVQIWDTDGRTLLRSPSLRGRDVVPPVAADPDGFWDVALPDGRPGRAVRLRFVPGLDPDEDDPPGPPGPTIPPSRTALKGIATPTTAPVARPSSGGRALPSTAPTQVTLVLLQDATPVRRVERVLLTSLLLASAGVCAGVLLVVPWVVKRGLAALQNVSQQAARIDASRLSDRFAADGLPSELRPICQRLNDLLARLQEAFARERRFSADVAHELRTPIAELRALSEVALKWPPAGANATRRTMDDALAIARQMEAVVTTLLALARCDAGRMQVDVQTVDLCTAVREAWRPLASTAEARRLSVGFELPESAPISSDPAMIAAVVGNLLSNAATYCPVGGAVQCAVRCNDGDSVELSVSNTNDSLSPEELGQIFQPFWRKEASRSDASHSGLGLTLVSAYAKLLGAELTAAIAPPGNQFIARLRFPCHINGANAAAHRAHRFTPRRHASPVPPPSVA